MEGKYCQMEIWIYTQECGVSEMINICKSINQYFLFVNLFKNSCIVQFILYNIKIYGRRPGVAVYVCHHSHLGDGAKRTAVQPLARQKLKALSEKNKKLQAKGLGCGSSG
jgi:hypothetical protein